MPLEPPPEVRRAYVGDAPVTSTIPAWGDLCSDGPGRRRFLDYWRGMDAADWRDLVAIALLRSLPVDWSSAFGGKSGSVRGPRVYRVADATARANLARLQPELPDAVRERMLAQRWRCVGRTMAEFSVSDRLIAEGRIQLSGADHLLAARARGRGVLLTALHLGNWEVIAAAHKVGLTISSFYQPRPTRGREHISQVARRRLGYRLLHPGPSGVREALRVLRAGETVMIFPDEEVDGVVRAPLFGRAAHKNGNLVYAARLAQMSGATVIPAYVLRGEGSRMVVHFAPEVALPPAGAPGGLPRAVEALNTALEPLVLAHLDQWYHLHEAMSDPAPAERLAEGD